MVNSELFWLWLVLLFTALLWLPYITQLLIQNGPKAAMGYGLTDQSMPEWAQRAKKAHYNAVENLVIFAPSVIVFHQVVGDAQVQIACQASIYFCARVIHYFSYMFKVPYVRTLSFFLGWGAQICIFYKIFRLLCPCAST